MKGRVDPVTGKCIFTNEQLATPIKKLGETMDLIAKGKFVIDRENDDLTRALGNKEASGRTRGTPGSPAWMYGFADWMDTYRSRERNKKRERERVAELQEMVHKHEKILKSMTGQGGTGEYREVDPL
jgi:hypothetical protein